MRHPLDDPDPDGVVHQRALGTGLGQLVEATRDDRQAGGIEVAATSGEGHPDVDRAAIAPHECPVLVPRGLRFRCDMTERELVHGDCRTGPEVPLDRTNE